MNYCELVISIFVNTTSKEKLDDVVEYIQEKYSVSAHVKKYYKFNDCFEVYFYIEKKVSSPSDFLVETVESLGGNWKMNIDRDDSKYYGDAMWNPDMGGKIKIPAEVEFATASAASERHST